MNSGEFNQGKQFIPTKSFQEYVDDWKNNTPTPTQNDIEKAYFSHLQSNAPMMTANAMIHQADAITIGHLESELTIAHTKNNELKTRINELEATIENMKAIAGEKIEPVNGISSVDYPNDNETQIEVVLDTKYGYIHRCVSCQGKHITDFQSNFNYCPNCGRKIIRK